MLFTKGKDIHKDCLTSFELALREAEIADLNLVSVSSILPPRCKIVSRQEGRKYLRQGQGRYAIIARAATNEPNRLVAASIGLARPADESQHWYLSEHCPTGETAQKAGEYAENIAMEMFGPRSGCQTTRALRGTKRRSSGGYQKKFT